MHVSFNWVMLFQELYIKFLSEILNKYINEKKHSYNE